MSAAPRSDRTRPSGITRTALWLLALAAGTFGIAATTGAGWLLVLIAVCVAVVIVAAVSPWFLLRRLRIRVDAPPDGTVGEPLPVTVGITGPRTPCLVDVLSPGTPPGKRQDRGARRGTSRRGAVVPAEGTIPVNPASRGAVTTLTVILVSAAPLGLVRWRRTVRATLTNPTLIAPKPSFADPPPPAGSEARQGLRELAAGYDLARGVREYVPGDPPKLIHWPATARMRNLMVKEVETPGRPSLVLVLDLRGCDEARAEKAASLCFGLAIRSLEDGVDLFLATTEPDGPRLGRVSTRTAAGRRLALAVEGPMPDESTMGPRRPDRLVVSTSVPEHAAP